MLQLLQGAVRARLNIVVTGGTDLTTFCIPSPHH